MNLQFKDSNPTPISKPRTNIPFHSGQATFPENWSTSPSLGWIRIGDKKAIVAKSDSTWLIKDLKDPSKLRFTRSK